MDAVLEELADALVLFVFGAVLGNFGGQDLGPGHPIRLVVEDQGLVLLVKPLKPEPRVVEIALFGNVLLIDEGAAELGIERLACGAECETVVARNETRLDLEQKLVR
ncbi:hypothetical protein PG995_006192 [Apiospora arundinis]